MKPRTGLQPGSFRICDRRRGRNRCLYRKIRCVNLVCLGRPFAPQRLLRLSPVAGIVGAHVTIGENAASAHNDKEARCNEQSSHFLNS